MSRGIDSKAPPGAWAGEPVDQLSAIRWALLLLLVVAALLLYYRQVNERRQVEQLRRRGLEYYSQGYFEEAELELKVAVRLGADSAGTYYALGKSQALIGKTAAAVQSLKKATHRAPNDREYRYNLALAYRELGAYDSAATEMEKSVEKLPKFAPARLALFELYLQTGRDRRAMRQYRILTKMGISRLDLSEIHLKLAQHYRRAKKKAAARRMVAVALQINPGNRKALELEATLAKRKPNKPAARSRTVSSSIVSPFEGQVLKGPYVRIRGEAAALLGQLDRVEVSVDGGESWQRANDAGNDLSSWMWFWNLPSANGDKYEISSRAFDSAGNVQTPVDTVKVLVDNAPPRVSVVLSKPRGGGWWRPDRVLLLTDESVGRVVYRWAGDDWQVYRSAMRAKFGKHRLYFYAVDRRANTSEVQQRTIGTTR